jgi:chemotaxis protein methyltransferase CheR
MSSHPDSGADASGTWDLVPRLRMSPEEARLVQEIIHEYCGLAHGLDSTFFLERRLGPRVLGLGLSTFLDYYHYLRYDPDGRRELEEAVERITTHETYLFRERYQLDAFAEEIVPDLWNRLRMRKRLLVWSAGCSTGEEVYTLAILLHEDERLRDFVVRVVGSDISRQVVAHARTGAYGPSSFRAADPHYRRTYFREHAGRYHVRDDLRAMCSFGQLNLLDTSRYEVLGPVDVIFCRNVLMYLSATARQRIVESFYDALSPGGYLLLGHSESLLNVTTRFDLVHLTNDLVYRRPAGGGGAKP